MLALLSGVALIVAGLKLRQVDNSYSSLLPAGGLVIFFLVIYGAHLYYHVIGTSAATAAIICNCLLAMWLGRIFASEIYGLFSVVGSYSAPLLLASLSGSVFDLAIYFTGWSVVFSLYALAIERRRPYLLAAFMALLVFHMVWGRMSGVHWEAAVAFQTLQFVIFLAAAIAFSIHHQSPMTQSDGLVHLPLLLVFYALQYSVLHQHVPAIAPWISIASACALLVAYGVAKFALPKSLSAGKFIVSAYCALVLFHAVYLELLPEAWAPWTVLLMLPLLTWFAWRTKADDSAMLPLKLLAGGLFTVNFLRVLFAFDNTATEHDTLLTFLYALELYVGYFLARQAKAAPNWESFILYAAHVGLMAVALQFFHTPVVVSLAWSALAISALSIAFSLNDKTLGQSSLLVFVAALIKLLLLDLSGAQPLLRIGSLLVVGIAMYVGGLLYKRIAALGD